MQRLRERILALGGIQAANSYVKVNLSLFDLYPREYCPSIPPEVVLLPFDLLYQMSSWTRAIVDFALDRACGQSAASGAGGLQSGGIWLPGVSPAFHRDPSFFTWHNFFLRLDKFLKWWERSGSKAIRRRAIEKAKNWMIERLHHSDGLGAIYPPMMYSVMALDVLGYRQGRSAARRSPAPVQQPDGGRRRPLLLPAVLLAGVGYGDRRLRAGAWPIRRHESLRAGGRLAADEGDPPQGRLDRQAPQYRAFRLGLRILQRILSGYRRHRDGDAGAQRSARRQSGGAGSGLPKRGLDWLLAMQSSDGGWAAFDADNNWEFLSQVPFADHNAMLDPTCADITGRVLEALARSRAGPRAIQAVRRGMDWLIQHQEADGSWYGRWGVAYIYGTCFALRGLAAAGRERSRGAHPARRRMASFHSECRWRLGRKLRQLRQPHLHRRPEHAVANRLGDSGPDRRRRRRQPQRAARHRVPAGNAARRWKLGRGTGHRHRFPASLLSELPPVQGLFPAARLSPS